MTLTRKERTLGCLWAMACGDALGVPSSFLTPEQIKTYKKEFHNAEILIGAKGNTPVTLKVQPKTADSNPRHEKGRDEPHGRE